MRFRATLLGLLALAACSSTPSDTARLTLNNSAWEQVNVQVVITRRADCDSRGEGYVSTREFALRKSRGEIVEAPNGATLCWRRDRNPNDPVPGAWSGWTRATPSPGQSAELNL